MDRSKSSPPASENLLEAEYVPTPFGLVCRKMEFRCLRCGRIAVIAATDEQIARIDCDKFAGSALVAYLAQEAGWVIASVKRQGRTFGYTVCPECVEPDFAASAKLTPDP